MPRKEGRKEHGNEKREEKKRIEEQRVKPLTPTPAIDALIGDEEQTGKKEEKRKKQGVGLQPSYSGPFSSLLRLAGIIW